jgi:chorismate mutase
MLEKYRKEIDEIDNQLINLLAQRMEVVKKV